MKLDRALILHARMADISLFLKDNHPSEIKTEGSCMCLIAYPYVYTKNGYCGFVDYHTNKTGNSIDLLKTYLGYSFQDAVVKLSKYPAVSLPLTPIPPEKIKQQNSNNCSASGLIERADSSVPYVKDGSPVLLNLPREPNPRFQIPLAAPPPYSRAYAYLRKRGIPGTKINELIQKRLLYQDATPYGNIVFVSRVKDFCELHGTLSYTTKSFHGLQKLYPDTFWSYRNCDEAVNIAYICECALDAISLAVIHDMEGIVESAAYIGIGGVSNQRTIDRICSCQSVCTVLAVDNDEAGRICLDRNKHLAAIQPLYKDWNEQLMCLVG